MNMEIEVKGTSAKHLEYLAQSLCDRFYGYTEKVKKTVKGEDTWVTNKEPRPYEMTFGTVTMKNFDSYEPIYRVTVSTRLKGGREEPITIEVEEDEEDDDDGG